jgi:hypothetical protein
MGDASAFPVWLDILAWQTFFTLLGRRMDQKLVICKIGWTERAIFTQLT